MKDRFIIIKLTPSNAFYSDKTIEVIGEFRPNELYTIIEYALSHKCSHYLSNGNGSYKFKIHDANNLEFELIDFQKFAE